MPLNRPPPAIGSEPTRYSRCRSKRPSSEHQDDEQERYDQMAPRRRTGVDFAEETDHGSLSYGGPALQVLVIKTQRGNFAS